MKKGLLIGGGIILAIVIVVVAVGVYVFTNLDSIIKTAVEEVGTEVTQTKVSLNEVEISLGEGSGALRGFSLANPQGYSDNNVMQFDEVAVALDLATVQSDPIVIKEIVIDGPQIVYEFGQGGSNIDTIKENVAGSAPSQDGGSDSSSGGGEGPKIVIENLILRNGQVSVTATELLGETIDAPLPDIHLKDIGKEGNGATPGQVATEVLNTVLAQVTTAVGAVDISKLTEQLNINPEDLTKMLGEGAGGITKAIEESGGDTTKAVEGAVEGAADEAGKALKGLLGND